MHLSRAAYISALSVYQEISSDTGSVVLIVPDAFISGLKNLIEVCNTL